jgi:chaperonin GroES
MQTLTEIIPLSDKDRRRLVKLFDPLNDVVIVAVDETAEKTPGGIILVESVQRQNQAQSGTIVAHGPGARSPVTGERVPLSVEVGDRVVFGQYAGNELRYGKVLLKAMREADCMTKVKDADALQPEGVRVRRRKEKAQ